MLNHQHLSELSASAINPELMEANFKTLGNASAVMLYSEQLPRRNGGRVSDSVLRRYSHLEHGGWYCSGLDAITLEDSLWGCFKSDSPRLAPDGKPIKYEHPPKEATEAFCLRVTRHIWRLVARRAKVECPDLAAIANEEISKAFWQWVKDNPEVVIIITEGAKKTASLLSQGYAAIGLPGIYSGYRSKDAEGNPLIKKELIPQLQAFTQPGREFVFCFDNDIKPSTVKAVRTAIANTGYLLVEVGCKVSVMTWRGNAKGIDDVIVAFGVETLDRIFACRLSLESYKLSHHTDLYPVVSHRFNSRYLGELVAPETAKLIGLQSAKGTGKTEWLAQQVAIALAKGIPVICVTHREQLGKDLGNRLGLEYRTEISQVGKNLGYVLCIDSLHAKASPPFNPDNWHGALVIVDEAEQVIWHALNSATCKFNRPAILGTLTELLANASKIILSDADLSRISIDYINGLLPSPVAPWVALNEYVPDSKRVLYTYHKPEALLSVVFDAIASGERVMVHTGGQKVSSSWGSINLEKTISRKFPDKKILRIDAESVAEKGHPAFGVMGNINAVLPMYDVVISSPTLETGVSIDGDHFDRVFAFATGSQTVSAVCQSLARVRADVPRHVWAKPYSSECIGNGSSNPQTLVKSQKKLFRANLAILGQSEAIAMDSNKPQHLATWATMSALQNIGFKAYRESILTRLSNEGYEVREGGDDGGGAEIKTLVKEVKDENYTAHCEEVAEAPILDDKEYDRVKTARAKTHGERIAEKATNIARRYATEDISPELVAQDDAGIYPKLRLHYYLTVGRTFVDDRDRRQVEKLTEDTGTTFSPDLNGACLAPKVRVLEMLNISQFFEGEHTSVSLQGWFDELVKIRHDIKTVLGMGIIPEKDSPIGVAQRLLGLIGLKMEGHQHRVNGDRQRTYTLPNDLPPERVELFTRWLAKDFERAEKTTAPDYLAA
jgi:hypothetical protein